MRGRWVIGLVLGLQFLFGATARALEIAPEAPHRYCEEMKLNREVRVFKDPSVFLGNLSLLYSDPTLGWEQLMNETPLLTTLEGSVHMMRLGEPRHFRNFGAISRLYEVADPRLKLRRPSDLLEKTTPEQERKGPLIVPVKFCGNYEGYPEAVGFVLKSDLDRAQYDASYENGGGLPPSTKGRPIPKWPGNSK